MAKQLAHLRSVLQHFLHYIVQYFPEAKLVYFSWPNSHLCADDFKIRIFGPDVFIKFHPTRCASSTAPSTPSLGSLPNPKESTFSSLANHSHFLYFLTQYIASPSTPSLQPENWVLLIDLFHQPRF